MADEIEPAEVEVEAPATEEVEEIDYVAMDDKDFEKFEDTEGYAENAPEESDKKDTPADEDKSTDPKEPAQIEVEPEEKNEDPDDKSDKSEDNESEFEQKILSPFRANGKEMQVNSAEEAISLMSKGANYNKKMLEIKPALSIVKALEKNELLSDDDINFFIALKSGNQDAIKQLLRDNKVDPYELEISDDDKKFIAENKVEKNDYEESDSEADDVMDSLADSEHYDELLDVMENLDADVLNDFYTEPHMIKELHRNIESGEFKIISRQIETQKALGNMDGVSFFEAYNFYANELSTAREFEAENKTKKEEAEKSSKEDIKARKKSINSTSKKKNSAQRQEEQEVDFLSMSDEDFEKFDEKYS